MAIIDLGKVSITWKGAYAGGTAYTPKDAVVYNNASYICIANTTGNLPTDTTYWNVMAAKGVDGTDLTSTLTTQGDVVYRDGSGLARLGFGTDGHVLTTKGTGANPIWAAASGGKIGQVLSTAVTTMVDADTVTSFEDVPGLTVAITPVATTSKILIDVTMNIGAEAGNHCMARLMRDSTPICIGTGDLGSKTACTWHMKPYSSSAAATFSMSFLDSPSSVSEIAYHMEWIEHESNSLFLNRTQSATDSAKYPVTASTITVSEVLA